MRTTATSRPASPRRRLAPGLAIVCLLLAAGSAAAQLADGAHGEAFSSGPFDTAVRFGFGGSDSYIEVPHSNELNPTGGFTFEAWVHPVTAPGCDSLAGKGYVNSWWVGLCPELSSYLTGDPSLDGGVVPVGSWHHIAVTWDGEKRRHFVDGLLTAERDEAGPPLTNGNPLRFGDDFNWHFTPDARLDEVRLWSRALNQAEINQVMRFAIRSSKPGLVAVWSFDNPTSCATFAKDELGEHDGTCVNTPFFFFETGNPVVTAPDPPAGPWLATTELPDFEFKVRITAGEVRIGTKVNDCVPDTLCVAGALPNRTEIFLRIIGPRPNGFLWSQAARFTTSEVEVWVRQTASGQVNYYPLSALSPDTDDTIGYNDRFGFLPD